MSKKHQEQHKRFHLEVARANSGPAGGGSRARQLVAAAQTQADKDRKKALEEVERELEKRQKWLDELPSAEKAAVQARCEADERESKEHYDDLLRREGEDPNQRRWTDQWTMTVLSARSKRVADELRWLTWRKHHDPAAER